MQSACSQLYAWSTGPGATLLYVGGGLVLRTPSQEYVAKFQKLADRPAEVGPPGMSVSCSHFAAHAEKIVRGCGVCFARAGTRGGGRTVMIGGIAVPIPPLWYFRIVDIVRPHRFLE
jgi:hypothetical protein